MVSRKWLKGKNNTGNYYSVSAMTLPQEEFCAAAAKPIRRQVFYPPANAAVDLTFSAGID